MNKVCYNGKYLSESDFSLSHQNRAFRYGDAFFETIRCQFGTPIFWEEHYFRIAGSFLVMKMSIPKEFSIENFQNLIKKLLVENNLNNQVARIRISFYRNGKGYYLPEKNSVDFIIESDSLTEEYYKLSKKGLKLGVYKENIISNNNLTNLKSSNRLLNVLASIYSDQNNYDESLLINNQNNIVEATSGNIFIILNDLIITPPLSDGCIDGVVRKVLLSKSKFNIQEKSISFSDILNAQEIFITNVIYGVRSVSDFKNNIFKNNISREICDFLNETFLV